MSRFVSVAGEQVAELADRTAEAGRLSRGRALFRKGAVSDLVVADGSVMALVRGSGGDEYETSIGTAPAPPGVVRQIAGARAQDWTQDLALVGSEGIEDLMMEGVAVCPRDMDLGFACSCADWEEPCKHVVAVLLALADRVDLDVTELLRWRSVDLTAVEHGKPEVKPQPAPRSQSQTRSASRSQSEPQSSSLDDGQAGDPAGRSARLSELEALLGDTAMRVPTGSGRHLEQRPPSIEPALADFLGVDMEVGPVDVGDFVDPNPLFADVQLGPLADLGPEVAKALTIIAVRLEAISPD